MTHSPKSPIGVYDSGVGGLTVLGQLRAHLPGEDIIYFGDSANCPFGNRSKQQLYAITGRIFDFFCRRGVKLAVSACNTTSALFALGSRPQRPFEVLSIIEPISRHIAQLKLENIGVIATQFTVSSGIYERLVLAQSPSTKVWAQGSEHLARLIDCGLWDEIPAEVQQVTGALVSRHPLSNIVLACTHYPLVLEQFLKAAPGVQFLDPARQQAKAVAELLAQKQLLNPQPTGKLEIYTSGQPALFEQVAQRLSLEGADKIERLTL